MLRELAWPLTDKAPPLEARLFSKRQSVKV